MKSAAPPAATREKLLAAAQERMIVQGFVATSVEEICEGAGVTKGSFFHYFESKEGLARACMERFSAAREEGFRAAAAGHEDPLERLLAIVDHAIAMSRDPASKGCLVGTFAQEISTTHPELRRACEATFDRLIQAFSQDLALAKSLHAPRAPFDPQSLAAYFLAVVQGSLLLMKAKKDRGLVASNLRIFRQQVLALFGKPAR